MSETFPYIESLGKLNKLMSEIRKGYVPKEVNDTWLNFLALNKKDRSGMFQLLKFTGFIDDAKKPAPVWIEYKSSKNPKKALAKAIKKNYRELFAKFPDAHTRSKLELADYFRENSSLEGEDITKAKRTFLNLCFLADFGDKPKSEEKERETTIPKTSENEVETKPISDDTKKQGNKLSDQQIELFRQAKRCIENEIFRAAHVVAWIGFMDYLGDQLTAYGIKKIIADKENLSKLKIENIDDLREIVTDHAIIIMLREIKVFSRLEMTSIHGLLSKRNECAHPTNYRPGLSETVGYVNELLKRIEEIQSKK